MVDPELLTVALDPARWPSDFASPHAHEVFLVAGVEAAVNLTLQAQIQPFIVAFFEHAPKESRMTALQSMLGIIEKTESFPAGLAIGPYLFLEPDMQVLSSAALYFCGAALPDEGGDVTCGARMVIEAIESRLRGGESMAAGSLAAGILLMGDRRFLPRMHEAWELLDEEGRETMARARSGLATDAHALFLIELLEEPVDPSLYGGVAGSLASLALIAGKQGIHQLKRVVPVSKNPDNPIEVLETWTREEYGTRICSRLEALAATEQHAEEQVMPIVVEMWCSDNN